MWGGGIRRTHPLETTDAPVASYGHVSGQDKINTRLVPTIGAIIDHFTIRNSFTATSHGRIGSPNVAEIRAPSVRVGRARLSHS